MSEREEKHITTFLEKEFNVTIQPSEKEYGFKGSDLLEEATFKQLLVLVTNFLEITSPSYVVGSLFSKSYGYLVTAGSLYALSNFNIALDPSLKNISIETEKDWAPVICLLNYHHEEISQLQRATVRESVVRSIFAQHLGPVFKQLEKRTGVRGDLLWANVAFSLHWQYEKWIKEAATEEVRERIKEDFLFVTRQASPACFGLNDRNPLNISFDEVTHPITSKKLLLRKKCCLRYCIPSASNCTTCPGINEDERKRLLEEYESKH